jgi:hypothetical protein
VNRANVTNAADFFKSLPEGAGIPVEEAHAHLKRAGVDADVLDEMSAVLGLPDPDVLGPCCICREGVGIDDDPAEMHDPRMYDRALTEDERLVARERTPSHGLCHAQCGLDRGWVIS